MDYFNLIQELPGGKPRSRFLTKLCLRKQSQKFTTGQGRVIGHATLDGA